MIFDGAHLPTIPVHDLTDEAPDAAIPALARREPRRLADLIATGHATYPAWLLNFGDRRSRRWLERQRSPYLRELAAIAAQVANGAEALGGVYMLNLSYEWGCTSGAGLSPEAEVPHMLRTLDWPLGGLGRNLVVARMASAAGPWLNITWPGFVGTLTGMAPGRFAAAFNQPPMRKRTGWLPADWGLERIRIDFSRSLPPAHLLRRTFETCTDFAAAKTMLCETPIAMPAFFVLCGVKPGEVAVIERTERAAFEHPEAVACAAANHWVASAIKGRARSGYSEDRRAAMLVELNGGNREFGWLSPPVLNELTRIAAEMEPATGKLMLQGFEFNGPATRPLRLTASEDGIAEERRAVGQRRRA
jgi:hypothetical protein